MAAAVAEGAGGTAAAAGRQQVCVWHEGEGPAGQHVAGDRVVGAKVGHARGVLARHLVHVQLVAQLLLGQHT
eukprot:332503-Chlamydomonas_euryale.AAC.2